MWASQVFGIGLYLCPHDQESVLDTLTSSDRSFQCLGCGTRFPARMSVEYGFETESPDAMAETVNVANLG